MTYQVFQPGAFPGELVLYAEFTELMQLIEFIQNKDNLTIEQREGGTSKVLTQEFFSLP